jgi:hypothetical protein
MNVDPGTPAFRWMVGFGATATVVVAVVADVIAGEHPLHTATLGLVAVVVAVMRHRLAGRHEGLFAATRGAIVAQPALHALMKLLPASTDPGSTPLGHTAAETSTSVVHVLVAAAIVAGVASSERLFLAVAALQPLARWLRLLTWAAVQPRPPVSLAWPPVVALTGHAHLASVSRRGPPATARATAA